MLEELNREVEAFDDHARRGEDLAGRLHHEVLASRMRPMSEGVRGFPRMVRDVARELGKRVQFEVRGEATGVDRDILEKLEAPLNHLIRNALDHAIESPEDRQAAGKDPVGPGPPGGPPQRGDAPDHPDRRRPGDRPRPGSAPRSSPGAWPPPEMAERLTEAELLEFLFLPGFSTKEAVTEISGRGVGLDVVQDMVKSVGGVVRVASRAGQGTRFTLQLPITMSVVRALLVRIAGEPYAFPLNRIDRIVRVPPRGGPPARRPAALPGRRPARRAGRGRRSSWGCPSRAGPEDPMPVVVVSDRSHRFGMVVEPSSASATWRSGRSTPGSASRPTSTAPRSSTTAGRS